MRAAMTPSLAPVSLTKCRITMLTMGSIEAVRALPMRITLRTPSSGYSIVFCRSPSVSAFYLFPHQYVKIKIKTKTHTCKCRPIME